MGEFLTYNWPFIFIGIALIYLGIEYIKYRLDKEDLSIDQKSRQQKLPQTLVLSRSGNKVKPKQLRLLITTMLIMAVVMVGVILSIMMDKTADGSLGGLMTILLEKFQEEPSRLFNLVLLPFVMVAIPIMTLAVITHERLVLTKQGIRYQSPFKGLFSYLNPGWQLAWAEIESISLGSNLVRGQLIIRPRHGKTRRLLAHVWRSSDSLDEQKFKSIFSRMEYERELQQYSLFALEQLPLLRYIQEVAGITIDTQAKGELDYDLSKNPHTRMLMFILFGLMAYAIIDFVANDEIYVQPPPMWWFVCGAILIVVISVWRLTNRSIPKSNIIGLSVMLGIMFGLALYPGLLRVNQLTDNAGLVEYEYRRVAAYEFRPVMNSLPVIIMTADEYWLSLDEDAEISFKLRKGALDFYQIDMAPEYAKMRQWYCRKYAKSDPVELQKCENS
ncbi:MAG TPA: hypothetical protein VIQ03_02035 [Gammaproteobacteria bacterium]